jgi:hypothetical protein
VVASLLAGHLVSEVCRTERRIPAESAWCRADSAQNAVRFSRPVPGDSGSWQVLVEVTSTRRLSDASQAELGNSAVGYACRLVPVADGWRVVRCARAASVSSEGAG